MADYLTTRAQATRVLDGLSKSIDAYEKEVGDRGMPFIKGWNQLGDAHLEMEALVERLMTQLEESRRLAEARLDLLRIHHGYYLRQHGNLIFAMPGKGERCENPGRYQEDCGKCLRCQSISSGMPDLEALAGLAVAS